ncbi:MAG: DUF4440 domain-containing protein, partial [Armatimonadota bacterium]|nr:DUF4440 domain-containing protein [Armatimonadota bacterium]
MKTNNLEEEIKEFLDQWNRSILDKDVVTARQLRDDRYSATMPDGAVLSKEEEIALIASSSHVTKSISMQSLEVRGRRNAATVVFVDLIEGEYTGRPINLLCRHTVSLVQTNGRWRAKSSRMDIEGPEATVTFSHRVPRTIKSWVKSKIKSIVSPRAPSFQELAYIPYKPGLDYVLPPHPVAGFDAASSKLPIPPKELWRGYNYPTHGKAHVSKMLEIVYASDFAFKPGNRILDLGCGAGRMIRHLQDLSETCEIWGTDISAEHIY